MARAFLNLDEIKNNSEEIIEVHHKDNNVLNLSVENLMVVDKSTHKKIEKYNKES